MIVSDEEAEKKACCGPVGCGMDDDGLRVCCGSDCMAWITVGEVVLDEQGRQVLRPTLDQTGLRRVPLGTCGHAPELPQ